MMARLPGSGVRRLVVFFFLPGHTPMISWLDAAAAPRIFSYNTSFLIACLPPYTQTWWILGYLFWFIWTPVPVQWLMLLIFVPDVYDIGVTVAPRPRHWGGPSLVKSILMFRGEGRWREWEILTYSIRYWPRICEIIRFRTCTRNNSFKKCASYYYQIG